MKTINKIFLSVGVVAAALGTSSCVDDLDLLPVDPNQTTAGSFSEDPEGYMNRVLADVYMNFSTYGPNGSSNVTQFDGGMATFQRGIFILEEIPTDEANWLPTADVEYGVLQYGLVPSNSSLVGGIYSRLTINITLCNDFIRTVNEGLFSLTPDLQEKAQKYIRQCKILRSACYFYLIDLYGNVPYADESTPVGPATAQLTREDVTNRVINTLEEVVAEYGNDASQEYGFVGKEVAEALLVKFYLNAEVYTGTAQWQKCYQHAMNIINRHKGSGYQSSGLANDYKQLFGHNNDQYCNGSKDLKVPEIIWTLVQDEPNLKSWANSTFMINAYIGADTNSTGAVCDLSRWNMNSGWRCMTARRQFVEKFEWDASYSWSPDARTELWCTAAHGFGIDNEVLDQDHFGENGFLPVKYHNFNILDDGTIDLVNVPTVLEQVPVDYAMIRLAEIYLSAAEAAIHGASTREEALTFVNYIRGRAGLDLWTAADLTLDTLQDERQRELYTELGRRTDLIRYGKWATGYTWNWKGQTKNGTDLPAYSVLYPIPSAIVQQNGYRQNPGY